ncbi:MAG TPA: DinB family protein [Candidatus Krumholzibacteria bacterium]|nr:DinB family protein [Candidatus Krumholzibacteria bacterium]
MSVFTNPAGRAADAAAKYTQALLELLGERDPLAVLRELPVALRAAIDGLSAAELARPEVPGKWSIQHVVDHLTDQETVAAYRWRSVIAEDEPELRGYDQDRWAARLRYGAAPAATVLAELETLRRRNLRLLEALDDAEFERVGQHTERGPESVLRIMQLTAGHDLVHRRQIARILKALGKA